VDPELNNIMGSNSAGELARSSTMASNVPSDNIPGFRVDKAGNIELPLAGKIKVDGLNTTEVKELIRSKAAPYYKNPVVNVRLANFRVTVLGEVTRPGTYTVSNETISLLDAIGMAGDLTIYGKRENVLLVRKDGGKLSYIRFDLNSSSTFRSPYFILHQGDVIYVEPNKSKVASTDVSKLRSYSLIATGISLLIVILSRVNF
jgi:polysaccharide export outer membrane protein